MLGLHSWYNKIEFYSSLLFLARFPNAFAVNPSASVISTSSTVSGAAVPVVSPPAASSSLDTLKIEEVKPPATGTRKAKVLYDYDAADTSELSLLADEVGSVCIASICAGLICISQNTVDVKEAEEAKLHMGTHIHR